MMTKFREFAVNLADGVTLSCAERGDRDGQPLILLHGMSDSWQSCVLLMNELPASVRTIAISLRGHGDSSKPGSFYDMAEYATDVIGVMDALGIRQATIAGHSMGSLVAQFIAMNSPHLVRGLVLLGTFATIKGNAAVEQLWHDVVKDLRDPVDRAFVREFQESTIAQPVPAAFLEMVIAESCKLRAHVWRSAWLGLITEDHRTRLPRIAAPTLIAWGDRDHFSDRAEQEFLARSIPNARLVVHEGAGHALHWENPKAVAADIREILHDAASLAA
jgi:pimeloyl-ACP methyl ester carboxylesterase